MSHVVQVLSAKRYVVAAKTNHGRHKLFQIVCVKDGSLFATFPYFQEGGGILGEVRVPATLKYPTSLTIGEGFAASFHYVKYSHHPDGRAHFSQDGRVRTTVRRAAVPLSRAAGHLFTFMVQGVHRFDALAPTDHSSAGRGVVSFNLDGGPTEAVKFVAFIYSHAELAKRVIQSQADTPWFACMKPDGGAAVGICLATTYRFNGEPRYLMLTAERIARVSADSEVFLLFMGGFDPPEVAFDHNRDAAFLAFVYPTYRDLSEVKDLTRLIDLPGTR